MDIEYFRSYCLSKPGVEEGLPFGDDVLVFKVMGKMFALVDIEKFESVNLKCDPEEAVELRERYSQVTPGYHMNKKHWNTVLFNAGIPDRQILDWVDDSYGIIVEGLPNNLKQQLSQFD